MGTGNKSFLWNTTARHDIKTKARNFFCRAREDSQLQAIKLFILSAQLLGLLFRKKSILQTSPGIYSMKPWISLLLKTEVKKTQKTPQLPHSFQY